MTGKPDRDQSENSPESNAEPPDGPQKIGADSGTVVLGQSWAHHLKRLEAKRRAEAEPTRDQVEQDSSD